MSQIFCWNSPKSELLFLKNISNVKVCTYNGLCEAVYTMTLFYHAEKKKKTKHKQNPSK